MQSVVYRRLLVGLVMLVGLANALGPTLAAAAPVQTRHGDHWLIAYGLEHGFRVLTHAGYPGTWWTAPFFYPFQSTMALADNLFGMAPVYWLVRLVSRPDAAYVAWLALNMGASFLAAVWMLRVFGVEGPLGLAGAYLFAFGLTPLAHFQAGHGQLLAACPIPLALGASRRAMQTSSVGWLALSLSLLLWEWECALYLGAFLSLTLGVWWGVSLAMDRRVKVRWAALPLVLVAGAAVWAMLSPYRALPGGAEAADLVQIRSLCPTLTSWVTAPAGSVLWRGLSGLVQGRRSEVEHHLFPGGVLLLLLLLSPWLSRWSKDRKTSVALFLTAFCLFALTLSVGDVCLWMTLVAHIPSLTAFRAVTRIGMFIDVLCVCAVFMGLQGWFNSRPPDRRAVIGGIILATVLLDQMVVMPLVDAQGPARAAALETVIAPGDVVYAALDVPWYDAQLAAMWAGLERDAHVINGYSGHAPPGYPYPSETMSVPAVAEWLGDNSPGHLKLIYDNRPDNGGDTARLYACAASVSADGTLIAYDLVLPADRAPSGRIEATATGLRITNTGTCMMYRNGCGRVRVTHGQAHVGLPHDLAPGTSVDLETRLYGATLEQTGVAPDRWVRLPSLSHP